MKRLSFMAIIISCLFHVSACSAKNEPVPLSQDGVQKLNSAVMKRMKSVEMAPGQDMTEVMTQTLRKAIEQDVGYNFDLTIRRHFYYPDAYFMMSQVRYMPDAIAYVTEHTEEAFDKKYISQRTVDLIKAARLAGGALSPDQSAFVSYVEECQKKNNGVCKPKLLIEILELHAAIDMPAKPVDSTDESAMNTYLTIIDSKVGRKYQTASLGEMGVITGTDGSVKNLYLINTESEFIVNENKLKASMKYSAMVDEEMKQLKSKK